MIASHPAPTTLATETPLVPPSSQRLAALRYCLILVLLPLFAIPAGIALGRSDFFLHHGASLWVRSNDAVFSLHDRTCDVLVFGDSTAMTGIDPVQVAEHTGFRTCNIAVTNAVLAVTGNLTLDHFLAHNPKPGVLLVQLSPDDFQAENQSWHQTIYAEGMLEQLRHGSPAQSRRLLLQHPVEATAFAGYAVGYTAFYGIKRIWFHTTHLLPQEDSVQLRAGSTFFTPPSPARSSCLPSTSIPPTSTPAQLSYSRSLVAGYRQGYASRAGVILVNVAPIPACDHDLAAYSAELHGITSNRLLPLPIGLFNDGRHFTAQGSAVVSELVSQEIDQELDKKLYAVANANPPIDDRQPPILVASLRRARYPAHRALPPVTHTPDNPILGLLVYPRDLLTLAPPSPSVTLAIPSDLYDDPNLPVPDSPFLTLISGQ